jgi:hypothetical protein
MNTAFNLDRISADVPVMAPRCRNGKKNNVSNIVQPVRKVTVGDRLSSGGTDPIGGLIFVVEYMDGKTREVLVPSDGPALWDETVFLREGRTTKDVTELFDYEIHDPNDQVPSSLVRKLKATLAEHNRGIQAAASARYSKKATP